MKSLVLGIMVMAAGVLATGTAAVAAAAPAIHDTGTVAAPPSPAGLTLTATLGHGDVHLSATLLDGRGERYGDQDVAFYWKTFEFGPKGQMLPIGTSSTDEETGVATLDYTPTVAGSQTFVAEYKDGKTVVAQSAAVVLVAAAVSAYKPAPPKPLADVGNIFLVVLVAIVIAVWLTLVAQVVRVRRSLRLPASAD